MKSTGRQSIIVPALMLSAWLLFRLTTHRNIDTPVLASQADADLASATISVPSNHLSRVPSQRSERFNPNLLRMPAIRAGLNRASLQHLMGGKPKRQIAQTKKHALSSAPPQLTELNREIPLAWTRPKAAQSSNASLQDRTDEQPQQGPRRSRKARYSGAAWIFFRSSSDGVSSGGAPTLGGPQLGVRLNLALVEAGALTVSATARASAPVGGINGKEASAGLSFNTKSAPGLRLFVERRVPLDKSARPAWSALASYGNETAIGRTSIKARLYAETGLVQAQQANPFAYARLELTKPISKHLEIGMETVADAQRRAYRIDVGPVVSLREFSNPNIVISAAWRLRAAGNAKPKSGPTITVSTSF